MGGGGEGTNPHIRSVRFAHEECNGNSINGHFRKDN